MLLASSQGMDLSATFMGATLYGSHITGASNRNQSAFVEDMTSNGDAANKIDHIQIIGADYELAGIGFNVEHLMAKDYLKKSFAMVDYTFELGNEMSLYLDARYATAEADGKLGSSLGSAGLAAKEGVDYESSFVNLNATLNFGNAYFGVGYNKVKDGDFITANANEGNNGVFNSSLSQWYDYNLEGEEVYMFTIGYNFADLNLPGLNAAFTYATADGAKNFENNFEREEWNTNITYAFSGQLEGLSLRWYHATGEVTETVKSKAADLHDDVDANRFYLVYSLPVSF